MEALRNPPSKAVTAADAVHRFTIKDLEHQRDLARAFLLTRTLVHLGFVAWVCGSSSHPKTFLTDETDSWLIDLTYADGPMILHAEFSPSLLTYLIDLPEKDLDAMAQLLVLGLH